MPVVVDGGCGCRRWEVGEKCCRNCEQLWNFQAQHPQHCGQRLWMSVERDDAAGFAVMGQQRGIVGVDIVRTFLKVQPVERTGRGRREATSTKFGGQAVERQTLP